MNASNLVFHEIQGNAPIFACNYCGARDQATGWLMADVPIGDGDTVSIVCCSARCATEFKAHPYADRYLADLFGKVRAVEESAFPSSGGPFKGYVFRHAGKYDPEEVATLDLGGDVDRWLQSQTQAIKAGVEVMVTDCDDYAVFHAKDRRIVFPPAGSVPGLRRMDELIKPRMRYNGSYFSIL